MTDNVSHSSENGAASSKPAWLRIAAGVAGIAVMAIPFLVLFQVARSENPASLLWLSMLGVALPCLATLMLFRVALIARRGFRFN